MSLLKRLFGGGPKPQPATEVIEHNGFRITPCPINEGGQYRISARIEAEIGDETKSHTLIRADLIRDPDEAKDASIRKAKQMIDQMGESLFAE